MSESLGCNTRSCSADWTIHFDSPSEKQQYDIPPPPPPQLAEISQNPISMITNKQRTNNPPDRKQKQTRPSCCEEHHIDVDTAHHTASDTMHLLEEAHQLLSTTSDQQPGGSLSQGSDLRYCGGQVENKSSMTVGDITAEMDKVKERLTDMAMLDCSVLSTDRVAALAFCERIMNDLDADINQSKFSSGVPLSLVTPAVPPLYTSAPSSADSGPSQPLDSVSVCSTDTAVLISAKPIDLNLPADPPNSWDSGLGLSQFLARSASIDRARYHSDHNALQADNHVLKTSLEKEQYRRKHCEDQIKELHSKMLDLQQQVAVSVATDNKKDTMIEQLGQTLTRVVDTWKRKETVRKREIDALSAAKDVAEKCQSKQQEMLLKFEKDLSQAVEQLSNEQNQFSQTDTERRHQLETLNNKLTEMQTLLSVEKEKVGKHSSENQFLQNENKCLKERQSELEDDFKNEQTRRFTDQYELEKKIDMLNRNHHDLLHTEKGKSDNMTIRVQELSQELSSLQKTLEKLDTDLNTAHRENVNLRQDVELQAARHEAALSKREADVRVEMEHKAEERITEVQENAKRSENHLTENHRHQLKELSQNHKEESEKQSGMSSAEISKLQHRYGEVVMNYEQQLNELGSEVKLLREERHSYELKKMEALSKLKSLMQAHCSQAMCIVGGAASVDPFKPTAVLDNSNRSSVNDSLLISDTTPVTEISTPGSQQTTPPESSRHPDVPLQQHAEPTRMSQRLSEPTNDHDDAAVMSSKEQPIDNKDQDKMKALAKTEVDGALHELEQRLLLNFESLFTQKTLANQNDFIQRISSSSTPDKPAPDQTNRDLIFNNVPNTQFMSAATLQPTRMPQQQSEPGQQRVGERDTKAMVGNFLHTLIGSHNDSGHSAVSLNSTEVQLDHLYYNTDQSGSPAVRDSDPPHPNTATDENERAAELQRYIRMLLNKAPELDNVTEFSPRQPGGGNTSSGEGYYGPPSAIDVPTLMHRYRGHSSPETDHEIRRSPKTHTNQRPISTNNPPPFNLEGTEKQPFVREVEKTKFFPSNNSNRIAQSTTTNPDSSSSAAVTEMKAALTPEKLEKIEKLLRYRSNPVSKNRPQHQPVKLAVSKKGSNISGRKGILKQSTRPHSGGVVHPYHSGLSSDSENTTSYSKNCGRRVSKPTATRTATNNIHPTPSNNITNNTNNNITTVVKQTPNNRDMQKIVSINKNGKMFAAWK